jgi:hypothetical protein
MDSEYHLLWAGIGRHLGNGFDSNCPVSARRGVEVRAAPGARDARAPAAERNVRRTGERPNVSLPQLSASALWERTT